MPGESRKDIIILDIDGTIIDSPTVQEATDAVKQAIKKVESTHVVSLATGRTWPWTVGIVESLQLQTPSIVAGGTEIRGVDGSTIWKVLIPNDAIKDIVAALSDYKDSSYLVDDFLLEDYLSGGEMTYEELGQQVDVRLIVLPFLSKEQAQDLELQVSQIKNIVAVQTSSYKIGLRDIHIMSSFATKEHAITELLKVLQIDVDRTTGIGDGPNDIHIFNAVKNKIAMGNATKELKDAADRVIGNVANDGLADYLNELSTNA